MNSRRGRLWVTVVCFLLGLLLVVQLRAQTNAAAGLEGLSAQDLTTLIANLNLKNGQLRSEITELEFEARALTDGAARGEVSAGGLADDLRRIRLWAGMEPARGRGAVVTFVGPVPADAVNDTLNELLNAGAEALAVGGVRVASGTVVSAHAGGLTVDGQVLRAPFDVVALGNPVNLAAILGRPGGLIGRIQVARPDVRVSVRESHEPLYIPATLRDPTPRHAKPRS